MEGRSKLRLKIEAEIQTYDRQTLNQTCRLKRKKKMYLIQKHRLK